MERPNPICRHRRQLRMAAKPRWDSSQRITTKGERISRFLFSARIATTASLKGCIGRRRSFLWRCHWCKRKAIAKAVVKIYVECLSSLVIAGNVEFPKGVAALLLSMKKLERKLVTSNLESGLKSKASCDFLGRRTQRRTITVQPQYKGPPDSERL